MTALALAEMSIVDFPAPVDEKPHPQNQGTDLVDIWLASEIGHWLECSDRLRSELQEVTDQVERIETALKHTSPSDREARDLSATKRILEAELEDIRSDLNAATLNLICTRHIQSLRAEEPSPISPTVQLVA